MGYYTVTQPVVRESELYHHGILGMRWGKRNGPPYPLTYNEHSAAEKKQNNKKELSGYTDSKGYRTFARHEKASTTVKSGGGRKKQSSGTDKPDIRKIENDAAERVNRQARDHMKERVSEILHSKKFKTGMKIAIGVAALYGATKLGKSALRKYVLKSIYQPNFDALPKNFSKLKDVPKAATNYYKDFFSSKDPEAWRNLTKGVNHGVNEENLLDNLLTGRSQNCTFCSASIVMRLKGYDVTAAKTDMGMLHEITDKWFTNVKMQKPKTASAKKLYKALLKQGDGTYGTLNVFWKGGQGGHSVAYVVKNGAVEILDGQLDKSYGNTLEALNENLFKNCDLKMTEFFNLTNCEPTEYILRAIM